MSEDKEARLSEAEAPLTVEEKRQLIEVFQADVAEHERSQPRYFCTVCGERITQAQLETVPECPKCGSEGPIYRRIPK